MSIPKIPPSTAKLFSRKRVRRQVVVAPESAEEGLDKTVQPVKLEVMEPPVPSPVVLLAPVSPSAMRRRG